MSFCFLHVHSVISLIYYNLWLFTGFPLFYSILLSIRESPKKSNPLVLLKWLLHCTTWSTLRFLLTLQSSHYSVLFSESPSLLLVGLPKFCPAPVTRTLYHTFSFSPFLTPVPLLCRVECNSKTTVSFLKPTTNLILLSSDLLRSSFVFDWVNVIKTFF